MIEHRSYIVAEIPEPVRSQIQALRESLKTLTARLPVEITLAGSSGVGPIPVGTDLSLVERHLDTALSGIAPFQARFAAIRNFPNTSIFYLEPFDRAPFDRIHQQLRASGIPFSEIKWPYNPHCTLRGGAPLNAEAASELLSRAFPREEFWIDTISLYQVDDIAISSKLLCQRKLGA
jgi:2'-5' RNA ligase